MKNIVITVLVSSLMIACGNSDSSDTVAQTGNGFGSGNTSQVCNDLLPYELARAERYNNLPRYSDGHKFYTSNGDEYTFRGNNKFSYNTRSSVTCKRLTAIDDIFSREYGFSKNCYDYRLHNDGSRFSNYAVNVHNNHEYPARYNQHNQTFNFYRSNNRTNLMTCPVSTSYYDKYFQIRNSHGEVYQESPFYLDGVLHAGGVYIELDTAEKVVGAIIGGVILYNILKHL